MKWLVSLVVLGGVLWGGWHLYQRHQDANAAQRMEQNLRDGGVQACCESPSSGHFVCAGTAHCASATHHVSIEASRIGSTLVKMKFSLDGATYEQTFDPNAPDTSDENQSFCEAIGDSEAAFGA